MRLNERNPIGLTVSDHAAGLQARTQRGGRLLAVLGCMTALAGGCAGSQESTRPAATPATEPASSEADARGTNPPAVRDSTAVSESAPREGMDTASGSAREAQREAATADPSVHTGHAATDTMATPAATGTMAREADNTDRNERDRNDANLTPMDQGNGASDVQLTAAIRKAVVSDDALSFDAKNVKIISNAGQVTLRGPVKSASEKARVESLARQAAGTARVTSQLEVAK